MRLYPTAYEESMNTVLTQEVIRYNRLLASVHGAMKSLQQALAGVVVMSKELEEIGRSLFNNQVRRCMP